MKRYNQQLAATLRCDPNHKKERKRKNTLSSQIHDSKKGLGSLFSEDVMAHNHAMIDMLMEEKDLTRTIAHMVCFNCRTYPSPTPLYYFMRSPYSCTQLQLDHPLEMLRRRDDIKTVTAFNGVLYLYSEEIMSRKYAQALANDGEAGEADF